MTLAKINAEKIPLSKLQKEVNSFVKHITSITSPIAIYLIGSAARDEFTEYSDLDFVIIVNDEEQKRSLLKEIHMNRPYKEIPTDFIILLKQSFDKNKTQGGIAFETIHHGKLLFERS